MKQRQNKKPQEAKQRCLLEYFTREQSKLESTCPGERQEHRTQKHFMQTLNGKERITIRVSIKER